MKLISQWEHWHINSDPAAEEYVEGSLTHNGETIVQLESDIKVLLARLLVELVDLIGEILQVIKQLQNYP